MQQTERILLDDVRVIDGTGAPPKEHMAVLVSGGRVESIGPSSATPKTVERISAGGKTLMPGMIDCHAHFTGEATGQAYKRYLDPPPGVKMLRAATDAYEALAGGTTTVRDPGTGGGKPFALRRAIADGIIIGPRIYASGSALSQSNGHGDWHLFPYEWVKTLEPRAMLVDGVDECRKAVRLNFREGADFIKVFLSSGGVTNTPEDLVSYPEFSLDELQAIVEEAHRREKRVAAHATGAPAVLHGLAAGVDSIEHGRCGADRRVLEKVAETGTFLCPTLSIFYWISTVGAEWGIFAEGIEAAKVQLEEGYKMVEMARDLGVKLANSTDVGSKYGRGLQAKELELMVTAGLTPSEAIVAATRTAAECIGVEADLGTVEVGKKADLLLVDGDPLADIRILQNRDALTMIMRADTGQAAH